MQIETRVNDSDTKKCYSEVFLLFPMRAEVWNVLKRLRKIASETKCPVIDVDMGGRLFVGHFVNQFGQPVLREPLFHVRFPPDGENYDSISEFVKTLEKFTRAGAWRVKVVGAFPAVKLIQDSIQINADD